MAIVPVAPPAGSDAVSTSATISLDGTVLNSLANSGVSSSLVFSNPTGASTATVVIELGSITPSGGSPNIVISDGSTAYFLNVATTTSPKRLTFVGIATSFLSSFTIENKTGVSLASSNNFITVVA